jgi:hypothetical protein
MQQDGKRQNLDVRLWIGFGNRLCIGQDPRNMIEPMRNRLPVSGCEQSLHFGLDRPAYIG